MYLIIIYFLQGCKPVGNMKILGGCTSASPYSSFQPSPFASYNTSPASSSFPSPGPGPGSRSFAFVVNANVQANSLFPWLKEEPILCILISLLPQVPPSLCPPGAPVTPPSSSPTARTPLLKSGWGNSSGRPHHYASLPSSTPPSPWPSDLL
ncbi:hypothetical protein LguiA_035428 [Lonicera macranthoides]